MTESRSTPQGHLPTLLASFLHFDLSFMLWVLLGALGNFIADDLHLTPAEKGLLVALPILSGSLLRLPLGLLADRFGGKRVGLAMLAFLYLPLLFGWQAGTSLNPMLGVGLMLGVAGASFAVALPLASRWYPAHRQGVVMGVAAAGNSGTVLANLIAPALATTVGWHNVLALATIPLTLVLLSFFLMAKDSPARVGQPLGVYLAALRHRDVWYFGLIYSVTFGGFVGLASFLPVFLRDQYAVTPVVAGYLTALCAFAGSAIRPIGGYLADRLGGGVRPLSVLLVLVVGVYGFGSTLPPLAPMMALLLIGMLSLGAGNGAVFQLVPQRFSREIGVATGLIGAIGGLGGFFLPTLLGNVKQSTGSFGPGFALLTVLALGALVLLQVLVRFQDGWRISWRVARLDEAT
jgi:NNP family nitrate/nitrite transporter-like MFS transporter